jgi:uncharacterized protein YndB with AHSA1/START domain
MTTVEKQPNSNRELVITRLIDAPRAKVYKAWTDPELIKQWWAPRPWTTPVCEIALERGATFRTVMRGPENEEHTTIGVFLDVVPAERIVFTDAFISAWVPSEKPFMTAEITLEDEGGKTRYTARVLHWSYADREQHEKMGFHEGWGQCIQQLGEVASKL